ncbi:MAG: DUF296 domain-containing protein [Prochlorococcaceae cyanobacterium]
MQVVPMHLGPGSDLLHALELLGQERRASGFVLSVVGNLSQAAFQCPGKAGPTVLRGELEIITLQGTVAPGAVHLHLSAADADCQVWGGHLEPGCLVLRGADLLVGLLESAEPKAAAEVAAEEAAAERRQQPRLELAVLPGCPFSRRALRMLRTLGIPHRLQTVQSEADRRALVERSGQSTFPQVFLDGTLLGGYDALAELHGRGALDALRA